MIMTKHSVMLIMRLGTGLGPFAQCYFIRGELLHKLRETVLHCAKTFVLPIRDIRAQLMSADMSAQTGFSLYSINKICQPSRFFLLVLGAVALVGFRLSWIS